ncbi:hypothetical protein AQUCO_05800160v1 [Aquilegia coerulea]|uniref:Uncharacterized protein n=1 Tax=Aquilegia coerulea TaxID=218851 RepID=A0A2G5CF27_AQUCA|nr:hypothetical protein AQUCO_05800160v1 [Aquilegia coerulea]
MRMKEEGISMMPEDVLITISRWFVNVTEMNVIAVGMEKLNFTALTHMTKDDCLHGKLMVMTVAILQANHQHGQLVVRTQMD